jgi:hypothetical protein
MKRNEILELIQIYLGDEFKPDQFEKLSTEKLLSNLRVLSAIKNTNSDKKYFSVHCLNALESRQFSILRANIENTYEKRKLARKVYPFEKYHIEYHDEKKSLTVVI